MNCISVWCRVVELWSYKIWVIEKSYRYTVVILFGSERERERERDDMTNHEGERNW